VLRQKRAQGDIEPADEVWDSKVRLAGSSQETAQGGVILARYPQRPRQERETSKNHLSEMGKRGYRAEVRRERKKRDILSPVNVLKISSNTHQLRFNISNCPVRGNTIFKKTLNSVEKVFASQDFLSNGTVRAYGVSVDLGSCFSSKIFSEIKRKGLRQGGKED
jgi:hypothetical protein